MDEEEVASGTAAGTPAPDEILAAVEHRPWPLPRRRWSISLTFANHLFMHWPVAPDALRPLVPPTLDLDTRDGQAWVSVLSTRIQNLGPRGLPWSDMRELTVRTYVRGAGMAGFYFLSLEATSAMVVTSSRLFFHLPFHRAQMSSERDGAWTVVKCRRAGRGRERPSLRARYRPVGELRAAAPGTIEHWLTERYGYFTVDKKERLQLGEIHHRPWRLRPTEAVVEESSLVRAAGVELPAAPPLAYLCPRLDLLTWTLRPLVARPRSRG